MTIKPKAHATDLSVPSVVDNILRSFVEALAAEDGMAEIATRLETTVVEMRAYSEASLRAAIFGEDV